MWGEILKEIAIIESKGELLIILGDMNRNVGGIVRGNSKSKISHGG